MHHDAVHYFTLFMLFIFIPGVLIGSLGFLAFQARTLYLDTSLKVRRERLRRHFRYAYTQWKKDEAAGEYIAYISRQNAEMFHNKLKILGA